MKLRDLVPWLGAQETTPEKSYTSDPFSRFQGDMERMMSNLFSDVPSFFSGRRGFQNFQNFSPSVNVEENLNQIKITAELPGLEQKDLDIQFTEDAIYLRGEKKLEHKEEKEGRTYFESSYGSFQRTIPLNCKINEDEIKAELKNGLLTMILPKREDAQSRTKKISVK